MDAEKIYATIESLSKSQGFYGRLLEIIDLDPKILDDLAEMGFADEIDLILYLEG